MIAARDVACSAQEVGERAVAQVRMLREERALKFVSVLLATEAALGARLQAGAGPDHRVGVCQWRPACGEGLGGLHGCRPLQ